MRSDLGEAAAVAAGPLTLAQELGQAVHRPERKRTRESTLRRLLVLTDVLALTAAYGTVVLLGGFHDGQASAEVRDLFMLAIGIPLWVLLAQAHNLYHADSRRADHGWTDELVPIIQMATLWCWAILLGISATGIRHVTIPKLALFWVLTIVLLLLLRSATRFWARRQSWYVQSALVIGPSSQAAAVVSRVLRHPEYKINVVACVDSERERADATSRPNADRAVDRPDPDDPRRHRPSRVDRTARHRPGYVHAGREGDPRRR